MGGLMFEFCLNDRISVLGDRMLYGCKGQGILEAFRLLLVCTYYQRSAFVVFMDVS